MMALRCLMLALVASAAAFHVNKIDEKRAKNAREHFGNGRLSLEEIKQMKDIIHEERLQNQMCSCNDVLKAELATQQRLLEEELDLQINLLMKENQKATEKDGIFSKMKEWFRKPKG